ncbi:MAG: hypothetical protein ABJB22_07525 [Verrucomicrobiota bacterium]
MPAFTRRQPFATRWRARFDSTLSELTARDNPKVEEVKADEMLDDRIVKEMNETELGKSVLAAG